MKLRVRKAVVLVNTFSAVGYTLLLLSTLLLVSAIAWLFMQSSTTTPMMDSSFTGVRASQPDAAMTVVIGYIVIGVMILLSLILVSLFSYLVGKWGSRVLKHFMRASHIAIGHRTMFLTKGILAMIPLVGFIVLNFMYETPDMVVPALHITAIVVSLLSIGSFFLQAYIARSLSVSARDSW